MKGKIVLESEETNNIDLQFKILKRKKNHFFLQGYICKKISINDIYIYKNIYLLFSYNNSTIRFNFIHLKESTLNYIMEVSRKVNNITFSCLLTIDNNCITSVMITIK